MAIIDRWFSTTSAGAGDGTSWANRAALFSSGNWSSVITGFNFAVDSMIAHVGPGTYSNTQSMASSLFANPPTQSSVGRLSFVGCDNAGVKLTPIDPDWNCTQGSLDTTGYPLIETNTNINNNTVCISMEFLCLTRNSGNGAIWSGVGGFFAWGKMLYSASGTFATCCNSATTSLFNCEMECSGTTFDSICFSPLCNNVRVTGNSAASSGNRRGFSASIGSGPFFVSGCQVGFRGSSFGSNNALLVYDGTIVNCTTAIELPTSSSGGTACLTVFGCMIANCTTGITQPFGRYELSNTRLRNTSNVSPANELPINDTLTAAGSDDDEFVDAASGDYRIKNTSIYWGRNIGAGDQPAAGGSSIQPSISAWVY
jgi:hypothetical protein